MADQTHRGGQKQGNLDPSAPDQHKGTATQGAGQRADADKRQDQTTNPDDTHRQPTDRDQKQ